MGWVGPGEGDHLRMILETRQFVKNPFGNLAQRFAKRVLAKKNGVAEGPGGSGGCLASQVPLAGSFSVKNAIGQTTTNNEAQNPLGFRQFLRALRYRGAEVGGNTLGRLTTLWRLTDDFQKTVLLLL